MKLSWHIGRRRCKTGKYILLEERRRNVVSKSRQGFGDLEIKSLRLQHKIVNIFHFILFFKDQTRCEPDRMPSLLESRSFSGIL